MSNFFKNLYTINKRLARVLVTLMVIQLVVSIVRVEITPFYVYSMFSWNESKMRSDTMTYTFVKIGDKQFPNSDALQLRFNNDFLPDKVSNYFQFINQKHILKDSAVDAKIRRRIPQSVVKNAPQFLKNFYRENVPSLINEVKYSTNTDYKVQQFPNWLLGYIQEKENNYIDSVKVYRLKVWFHEGKFDTINEIRIL